MRPPAVSGSYPASCGSRPRRRLASGRGSRRRRVGQSSRRRPPRRRGPSRRAAGPPRWRKRAQDARRLGRGELLEDRRDLLVRQPLDQDRDLARLDSGHQVRPFRGTDALGQASHAVPLALADERLDFGEQLASLDLAHRTTSLGRRATGTEKPPRRGTVKFVARRVVVDRRGVPLGQSSLGGHLGAERPAREQVYDQRPLGRWSLACGKAPDSSARWLRREVSRSCPGGGRLASPRCRSRWRATWPGCRRSASCTTVAARWGIGR